MNDTDVTPEKTLARDVPNAPNTSPKHTSPLPDSARDIYTLTAKAVTAGLSPEQVR